MVGCRRSDLTRAALRSRWRAAVLLATPLLIAAAPVRTPAPAPDARAYEAASQQFDDIYHRAMAGEADAQAELGRAYAHGWVVRRDINEAMRWLTKAVKQGSNPA